MNILHVTDKAFPPDPDEGGASRILADLVSAQRSAHHRVTVMTSASVTDHDGVNIQLGTNSFDTVSSFVEFSGIDIVHLHAHEKHFRDILEKLGIPSVFHMHGDHHGSPSNIKNCIYVSKSHANRHGAKTFVYNGLNVADYQFEACPGSDLVFLGKVRRSRKGADTAVAVSKATGYPLRLIGGRKLSIPETWIPLNPRVKALGILSGQEKISALRRGRALLFPIRWEEPFGLVLIEAMACGVPVIAFDRGAVSEIVVDGKTGFIVDDFQGMCSAVERIDEIDREVCRQHVIDHFSIDRTVKGVELLYQKAIAGETW